MRWLLLSLVVALALSFIGLPIVDGTFDIFGKVIYWLVVSCFLAAQLLHLCHMVRVHYGG
jgi:hypothetical protein